MGKTPITKLAQVALKTAVDNGKIIKPSTCEQCGKVPNRLHGHHEDYTKPLKVIWLCPACHRSRHVDMRYPQLPGEIKEPRPPKNSKSPSGFVFQKARRKLFTTQAEAAEAMGVSQGAIALWENGQRPIPDYAWIILGCVEREREEV